MDYLIVDMTRVLRESEHGKTAIASLKQLVDRSRAQEDTLRDKWEKSSGAAKKQAREQFLDLQAKRRVELDRRKDALQRALVTLANTAAKSLAEERGVTLILERSAVLVYSESADLTDEVIARVNAVKVGARKPTT